MGQSTIEEATVAPSSSDSVRARQNRIEETVAPSSSDSAQVSESLFVSCSSHYDDPSIKQSSIAVEDDLIQASGGQTTTQNEP